MQQKARIWGKGSSGSIFLLRSTQTFQLICADFLRALCASLASYRSTFAPNPFQEISVNLLSISEISAKK
ncbi:MAG: hypothetical protein EAZ21_08565 [Betaproteobacteria bacterium]|nr:MAG: hypothetical protein EAZ21_08565 [Betaproteobacteria bacterium]